MLCFEYDLKFFFIKLRHKGMPLTMVNTTTVGPCLLDMLSLVRGKPKYPKKTLEAKERLTTRTELTKSSKESTHRILNYPVKDKFSLKNILKIL